MTTQSYGHSGYGTSPYGSQPTRFGVSAAEALSQSRVRVTFTDFLDASYPALLDTANYSIPGLTVLSVQLDSAKAVRLRTNHQTSIAYAVTVTDAHNAAGGNLDPTSHSANFDGIDPASGFWATATSLRRVRLTFDMLMRNDAELVAIGNYLVTDLNGNSVGIVSVTLESSTSPRSVVCLLDADLQPAQVYTIRLDSKVRTATGGLIFPATSIFQFVENAVQAGLAPISIPSIAFTGEIHGGLYGQSGGLLFFSPALETAIANSVIQVDYAGVCARAYDVYVIPQIPDPSVLYTYGNGHTEGIGTAALWAPFPRLSEACFELSDLRSETVPTFNEPWDQNYVSLLNNTHWKIYDGGATPPAYFIAANNLAPVPPGPSVVIVLQV
jgi:hypothetical protein